MGIEGNTLKWLQAFLTDRTQKVIVIGKLSSPHKVISGVTQGSIIGPLLFLVLINIIDKGTQHSIIFLFADETRAMAGIKSDLNAK